MDGVCAISVAFVGWKWGVCSIQRRQRAVHSIASIYLWSNETMIVTESSSSVDRHRTYHTLGSSHLLLGILLSFATSNLHFSFRSPLLLFTALELWRKWTHYLLLWLLTKNLEVGM